jgi:hypothetical protein
MGNCQFTAPASVFLGPQREFPRGAHSLVWPLVTNDNDLVTR